MCSARCSKRINKPDYSVVKDRTPAMPKRDVVANVTQAGDPAARPLRGGGKRVRTADPLLAKQVLFQLSYTPAA